MASHGRAAAAKPKGGASRAASGTFHVNAREEATALEAVKRLATRSAGRPIDDAQRAEMEACFGHDFSRIRIHTDDAANEVADALGADALTLGDDIYFAEGAWRPGDPAAEELLAHELAHVAQRGEIPGSDDPSRISDEDEVLEHEAEALARDVVRGNAVDPNDHGATSLAEHAARTIALRATQPAKRKTRAKEPPPPLGEKRIVDRLAGILLDGFWKDPTDKAGRVRAQLARLGDTVRDEVIEVIDGRLPDADKVRFTALLHSEQPLGTEVTTPEAKESDGTNREQRDERSPDENAQLRSPDPKAPHEEGEAGTESKGGDTKAEDEHDDARKDVHAEDAAEADDASAGDEADDGASAKGDERGDEAGKKSGKKKGKRAKGKKGDKDKKAKGKAGEKEPEKPRIGEGEGDEAEAKKGGAEEAAPEGAQVEANAGVGGGGPVGAEAGGGDAGSVDLGGFDRVLAKKSQAAQKKDAAKKGERGGAFGGLFGGSSLGKMLGGLFGGSRGGASAGGGAAGALMGPGAAEGAGAVAGDAGREETGGRGGEEAATGESSSVAPAQDAPSVGGAEADAPTGAASEGDAPQAKGADDGAGAGAGGAAEGEQSEGAAEGPAAEGGEAEGASGGGGEAPEAKGADAEPANDGGGGGGAPEPASDAGAAGDAGAPEAAPAAAASAGPSPTEAASAGEAARAEPPAPEPAPVAKVEPPATAGGGQGADAPAATPEAIREVESATGTASTESDVEAPGGAAQAGPQGTADLAGAIGGPEGDGAREAPSAELAGPERGAPEGAEVGGAGGAEAEGAGGAEAEGAAGGAGAGGAEGGAACDTGAGGGEGKGASCCESGGGIDGDAEPAAGARAGAAGGGGGGGGGAIADKPAPAPPPDVSNASPNDAMAAMAGLAPVTLQASLGQVSAASGRAVDTQRAELANNPPEVKRPSGAPADHEPTADTAALASKVSNQAAGKAEEVPAGAPAPAPTPEPAPDLGAPPPLPAPAIPGDTKVDAQHLAAMQAATDELPTTDPALNVTAGDAPKLDLTGDADPTRTTEQRTKLDEAAKHEQEQGAKDASLPMGEDAVYPKHPAETLKATIPQGGGKSGGAGAAAGGAAPAAAGGGGGAKGGAAGGAADDETASIVAQEQHGAEIATQVQNQSGAMKGAQEQQAKDAETQKAQSQEHVDDAIKASAKEQEETRTEVKKGVADQRKDWTTEQKKLVTTAQGKGDDAAREADGKVDGHRKSGVSKAAAHLRSGDDEIAVERERAEDKARKKKAEAKTQSNQGFFDWIGSVVKDFFDKVKSAIKDAFDWARKQVKAIIKKVQDLAVAAIEEARKAIVDAIKFAGDVLMTAADVMLAGFPELRDKVKKEITDAVDTAITKVNAAADELKKDVVALLDLLGKGLDLLLGGLLDALNAAIDAVSGFVNGVISAAKGLVQALGVFAVLIKDIWNNPGQWLSNLGAAVIAGIKGFPAAIVDSIKKWFDSVVGDLIGAGKQLLDVLKKGCISWAMILKMAWKAMVDAIPGILISILIEKLLAMIVPAAGLLMTIIQGLQAAWGTIQQILAAFDTFMKFLKAIKSGNAGPLFAETLASAAIVVIQFVAQWVLGKLKGAGGKVGGRLKEIATKILGALKKGAKAVGQFAKRAGQAIVKGAKWAVGKVKAGAKWVGGKIKAGAKWVGAKAKGVLQKVANSKLGKAFLHSKVGKKLAGLVKKGAAGAKKVWGKIKALGAKAKAWARKKRDQLRKWWNKEKPGALGESITFTAGGEVHRLWIMNVAGMARAMLASHPGTLAGHLPAFRKEANALEDAERKARAISALNTAEPLAHAIDSDTAAAKGLKKGKKRERLNDRIRKNEESIRGPLSMVFAELKTEIPGKFEPKAVAEFTRARSLDVGHYEAQLLGQTVAINRMNVTQWLNAVTRYEDKGRDPADPAARRLFRAQMRGFLIESVKGDAMHPAVEKDDYLVTFVNKARKALASSYPKSKPRDVSNKTTTAEILVDAFMRTQAALHEPDQVAGGAVRPKALGRRDINRDIGQNWAGKFGKPKRLASTLKDKTEQAAGKIKRAFWNHVKMNVELKLK